MIAGSVRTLYQDREGLLWIGTLESGVAVLDTRQTQSPPSPESGSTATLHQPHPGAVPAPGGLIWSGFEQLLDQLRSAQRRVQILPARQADPANINPAELAISAILPTGGAICGSTAPTACIPSIREPARCRCIASRTRARRGGAIGYWAIAQDAGGTSGCSRIGRSTPSTHHKALLPARAAVRRRPAGIRGANATALHVDQDGSLWIGGDGSWPTSTHAPARCAAATTTLGVRTACRMSPSR